jgi:hypothetical protein
MTARRRRKTIPREQRKRPLVTFTLSREAVAAVELLADELGLSKSSTVELAIRRLAARENVSREELQERVEELDREQQKRGGRKR